MQIDVAHKRQVVHLVVRTISTDSVVDGSSSLPGVRR